MLSFRSPDPTAAQFPPQNTVGLTSSSCLFSAHSHSASQDPLKSLLTLAMPFPSTLAPRHSSACQPSATADLTRHALGSSSQGLTAPVALTTLHRRKLKPRGLTCKVAKQEGGRHPTVCASTNTALWITSALPSCSTATTTTYILYCYETCLVSSPGSSLPRAHRRAEPES